MKTIKQLKICFHLGHPAHYYLFKNVIKNLSQNGHKVLIVIKSKEMLEDLVKQENFEYKNILPIERGKGFWSLLKTLIVQDYRLYKYCKRTKPDLLIGTSFAISHVGKLLGIKSINVNEDDWDIVPKYAKMAYPWATFILAPQICRLGKWSEKAVTYNGYHELAYLHPGYFSPDKNIVYSEIPADMSLFLIRLSKLTAHHDRNVTGLDDDTLLKICNLLDKYGVVYITSERKLPSALENKRLIIKPRDIHHFLYYSDLLICDSQTMSAEAGVLGTHFVRYNHFAGKISILEEIEVKYELGTSVHPRDKGKLLQIIENYVKNPDLFASGKKKRERLLKEKIDVVSFFTTVIPQLGLS